MLVAWPDGHGYDDLFIDHMYSSHDEQSSLGRVAVLLWHS